MWYTIYEEEMPTGKEIIAFSPEWIDADFNPNGSRIGFKDDNDVFISAWWNDEQDTYENIECDPFDSNYPTHWQPIEKKPV